MSESCGCGLVGGKHVQGAATERLEVLGAEEGRLEGYTMSKALVPFFSEENLCIGLDELGASV